MKNAQTPKVSIGIVGCGAIAELYHLPALQKNQRTQDGIAIAEPNTARRAAMAEKFGARRQTSDYKELLGQVDGVIVATPPLMHYAMAKFFLENGVHVLCEKPLSESSSEARELVEIGRRTGAKLAINQTRRFFPTYAKIRELIAAGVLGRLESITYHDGHDFDWPAASPHHFSAGAKGAWSDTGVHLLDSVCYWIGAKPTLVRSQNDSLGGPEAMATVNLEHAGCAIEVKVSRLGRLMNGFHIVGSLGSIKAEAEDWDEFTVEFRNGSSNRYKVASNRLTYGDFAHPMLENFVEVIASDAAPTVSGESVLGTIELLEQAYQTAVPYDAPWNDELKAWSEQEQFRARVHESDSPKRVLVTGVSGFLGGRVVEAMAQGGLFEPVAAIRSWSRAARAAVYPMKILLCDIMKPEQVDAAVAQVDAIVHCAYTDSRTDIVDGTKHLLEAAAKHSIRNFVYLSSAEVYGPDRQGTVSEDQDLAPLGRPYGDAKLEAEELCRSYAAKNVYTTILRPSLIYGPHGSSWSIDIAKKLQSGNWGLFEGFGEGFANLIYVDDLVQAIFLSLQSTAGVHRTFNVNGPKAPTWNQYFEMLNAALGLPDLRPIASTQSRLKTAITDRVRKTTSFFKARFEDRLMEIYLRGGWAGQMMKRLKNRLDSTPSEGELTDLYARKAVYSDEKIRRTLGYNPSYDLRKGVDTTIQWMLLHELIQEPNRVQRLSALPAGRAASEMAHS